MTLISPVVLGLAAVAALGVVLLHFIARKAPAERPLPTARFVPRTSPPAPARSRHPADLALLALRVLALLLLGVALAGPRFTASRRPLSRVVVLDRSRAVREPAVAESLARAELRAADVLIGFDSTARVRRAGDGTAGEQGSVTGARGTLSAALVLAVREAPALLERSDSLELVVVSPLVEEEWDPAVPALRALWPGGVRLRRVAARTPSLPGAVGIRAAPDDPLRASVALMGRQAGPETVRIVRESAASADSALALQGGVLVVWPRDPGVALAARTAADTIGALTAHRAVVVAAFVRTAAPPEGGVVARWSDGEPAATERPSGAGCVRTVAVPVDEAGDLALRPAMLRFVGAMTAPCGGERELAPIPDSALAGLLSAPDRPLAAGPTRPAGRGSRPLVALLLALGALLLVVEQLVRRNVNAP